MLTIALLIGLLAGAQPDFLQESVRIPMRDGVRLSARIFRPKTATKLPVILVRTPYSKAYELPRNYVPFVDGGYAVVIQDVRGRYESEGVFEPFTQEPYDGDDTLNWIAKQSWSNGKIGMMGGSYLGIVQWKAAITGNPHLKCIFPVVSGYDDYRDRMYSQGGAMKAGNRMLWISANLKAPGFTAPDFRQFMKQLPLKDIDLAATGQRVPMFQTAVEHPTYDEYWKAISTREKLVHVKVPVYSVGGWYDNFVQSDLEAFSGLRALGRKAHTLIGPWPHNMSIPITTVDFGPNSSAPISRIQMDWFDHWLKDLPGKTAPAPLKIFVMGANKWREEQSWPLARAVPTPFYFSSRKGANSLDGDGVLRREMPRRVHQGTFLYDPANPVPTQGGNNCCAPKTFPWGPMDQRLVEGRKDVLVFTTAALTQDTEVTGPIRAVLYVTTSVKDTDFTVKLVDVYPDGRAMNLTDGILRMRYREGLDKTVMAVAGKVYALTIDGGVTSNVFLTGHKIRVEVSSSNFPRFDRNMNTGRPNSYESKGVTAEQTVLMGTAHPSHVLLPIVHGIDQSRLRR